MNTFTIQSMRRLFVWFGAVALVLISACAPSGIARAGSGAKCKVHSLDYFLIHLIEGREIGFSASHLQLMLGLLP